MNSLSLKILLLTCTSTGALGTLYAFFSLLGPWGIPFAIIIIATPFILGNQLAAFTLQNTGILLICLLCLIVGVGGNYMTLEKTFFGNQPAVQEAQLQEVKTKNAIGKLEARRTEVKNAIATWNTNLQTELTDGGEGPASRGIEAQRDKATLTLANLDAQITEKEAAHTSALAGVTLAKRNSSSLQSWLDVNVNPTHQPIILTAFLIGLACLLEPIGLLALYCLTRSAPRPMPPVTGSKVGEPTYAGMDIATEESQSVELAYENGTFNPEETLRRNSPARKIELNSEGLIQL